MKINGMDHIVMTTADVDKCIHFYRDVLGMRHENKNGRHALYFGNSKINIHTRPGEFQPAAARPTAGSLDFCFVVDSLIDEVIKEIESKQWQIESGPLPRHGAMGEMESIYLRDPDGNLVELASYRQG